MAIPLRMHAFEAHGLYLLKRESGKELRARHTWMLLDNQGHTTKNNPGAFVGPGRGTNSTQSNTVRSGTANTTRKALTKKKKRVPRYSRGGCKHNDVDDTRHLPRDDLRAFSLSGHLEVSPEAKNVRREGG